MIIKTESLLLKKINEVCEHESNSLDDEFMDAQLSSVDQGDW